MKKHILIVSNTAWSIFNFRAGLIKVLLRLEYKVSVMAPADGHEKKLTAMGCEFIELKKLSQAGTSPLEDWKLYKEFRHLLKLQNPDIVLFYTPKPNIYGSMAASRLKIKYINTVNGLGYAFQYPGLLSNLMLYLYRTGFRNSHKVFFQNADDLSYFLKHKVASNEQSVLVSGSGVDTDAITPHEIKSRQKFVFLLCTRLIAEKGVNEYINASAKLHAEFPHAIFRIIGKTAINPTSLKEKDLQKFHKTGIIDYLEEIDDINTALNDVDVLVHPSYYREGIPRILLEGLSKGLPLITTDSVGCRETVKDKVNGLLIEPRSVDALVKAMRYMLTAKKTVLEQMGKASREKAVAQFREEIIIDEYLKYISN